MSVLRVMSRRGDDRVAWDVRQVEVGDPEAVAAVREAERIFSEQRARRDGFQSGEGPGSRTYRSVRSDG